MPISQPGLDLCDDLFQGVSADLQVFLFGTQLIEEGLLHGR